MSKAYHQLEQRFARMSAIGGAIAVLGWDHATMMPPGGAAARANQLSTLSVLRHEIMTAPEMPDLLAAANEDTAALNDWQAANLNEMHHAWTHASAVPADLVEQMSMAESKCEMAWREARANNDFAKLAPLLNDLIGLVRQSGEARSEALGLSVYDALIDQFDPGGRQSQIDPLFAELQAFLPDMLQEITARQNDAPPAITPTGPFPVAEQEKLAHKVMSLLGFDFSHGRLDTSHHPFSGGVPEDSRITTRYDEADFTSGLMAVIHETGHSAYERGLPKDWLHQPVGRARGMTMHESQSLLFEMQAARSPEFVNFVSSLIKQTFANAGNACEPDNLLRIYHHVSPGLIRVDADEVTYPLHIILRYRLEQDLIGGALKVTDLPDAWHAGMKDLLGIAPDTDADGCMQDIHWPSGAFGYFPSYTLGALAAAQIFAAAKTDDAAIVPGIAKGDFAPLNGWLRQNIHGAASRFSTGHIIEQATGKPLSVDAFKAHLEARYLSG
ncbi:MAG: carboxypeptidase M32 [Rhizobiales bacterium]|nr:carboxypeptidase M32 [Hyphomicrobiales bacterium]